jgi:hypothetical protein
MVKKTKVIQPFLEKIGVTSLKYLSIWDTP